MFDELIGKKIILKTEDGSEYPNLTLIKAEGCLIKIQGFDGKTRIINMSAPEHLEIVQQ